jgi:5-methyltetrahydrofolate corrinoid/iron sulfur protein methyltransferase
MILIGEGIHIISKEINHAIQTRDPKPIQKLARLQEEAGADYLDLNLGALSKNPVETMQWVVSVVQEAVTIPVSLDTPNPLAMEAALQICKSPPLINSANCGQASKETIFPLAQKYSADLIVLTYSDEEMPNDADSRAALVVDILEYANDLGIPNEKIWVDGVLMPICFNQPQIREYLEFIKMFGDVAPGARTITGLSNVSSCGVPAELRALLNQALFVILNRHGHSALIADVLDQDLMRLNRGELPELVELIHKAEDGEPIDYKKLTAHELAFVKTVDVLLGRKMYSHSWLEA